MIVYGDLSVEITRIPDGKYQAIKDYDGPGSPIGYGDSPEEAAADLKEQMDES